MSRPVVIVDPLSLWNVGDLIGSQSVDHVLDRICKPQWVMGVILVTLLVIYLLIPMHAGNSYRRSFAISILQ